MLAIPILCLGLVRTSSKPDDSKVTAVVEEVYRIDSSGAATALDAHGVPIPNPIDPDPGRGLKPTVPAGESLYRVVLRLTTSSSLPTFGRTYVESRDHQRIEVNQIDGAGNATGMRETLTFTLSSGQTSTVLHCKAAQGPFETFLDETIDDDHPHGLTRLENAIGGSDRGPMDVFEYVFAAEDLGKFEEKGTASFSDGTTSMAFLPIRRVDPKTGQVVGESLWFNGTKGTKPIHLVLKRRAFQAFEVGPVQLHAARDQRAADGDLGSIYTALFKAPQEARPRACSLSPRTSTTGPLGVRGRARQF